MTGKAVRRSAYPHFLAIPTRRMDNDVYGQLDNVVYYSYFDTVINEYLIREGGLDIQESAVVGVCAESHCRFRDSFAFPDMVEAGLRVGHLDHRAVRCEIGLFEEGADQAADDGHFARVFVERAAMTPVATPDAIRAAREKLALTPA